MTVQPTVRVPVAFHGTGAGVGELSWGQRELYGAMVRQNSWLPIGLSGAVPAGTSLDDVLADVRYAMGRYPSLRTRLRVDATGEVRQVVHDHGEVTVDVFDTPAGEDPQELAERIRWQYWLGKHDHETDWPAWVGVVRRHGVPAAVAVVLCHLVTDGLGSIVLFNELAGGGWETLPPSPMPPLEQAAWQRSPAGQRQCGAALAHWERALRSITPRRFPATTGEATRPRHWEGEFRSPALHRATQALAARTNVDRSPVMLAVFAVALARITAVNPVVVQVVASNRFRPGLAATVSPVNQTGLCVLDVADVGVEEAIQRTAKATIVAYKYAYYDPVRLDALVERIGRERGEPVDIACYFNDRRAFDADGDGDDGDGDGDGDDPGTGREALAASEFHWARRQDDPWERLFLHVENVPGTAALTVQADTRHVSRATMEALVHGMEAVAVEAVAVEAAPAADTGARPPRLALDIAR